MAYGNGGYDRDIEKQAQMQAQDNMQGRAFVGAGAGVAGVSSAPIPRMQAIPLELQRLNENTERLHAYISDLENRTSLIVRPEGPDVAATQDKALPPMVPLAGGLAELNARVEGACRRLMSVIERIEL